jgi:hypothetical protein
LNIEFELSEYINVIGQGLNIPILILSFGPTMNDKKRILNLENNLKNNNL